MPRYVALLRSVNVAGHGRIAMDELRAAFDELGYTDVSTYIQTGNVLFTASSKSEPTLANAIEQRLAEDFGDAPAVLLRSVPELGASAGQPVRQSGGRPGKAPVTFLATAPSAAALDALTLPPSGRDELVVKGKEVYVHTPDGYAHTKYTGTFLERRLGVVSTTRNWNTVTKLCALVTP